VFHLLGGVISYKSITGGWFARTFCWFPFAKAYFISSKFGKIKGLGVCCTVAEVSISIIAYENEVSIINPRATGTVLYCTALGERQKTNTRDAGAFFSFPFGRKKKNLLLHAAKI